MLYGLWSLGSLPSGGVPMEQPCLRAQRRPPPPFVSPRPAPAAALCVYPLPALPLPSPRCAHCQHRQPSCDDTHELKGELKGVLPLRATAAGCTWPSSSSRHSATRCFQPVRALPSRVEYPNPIAAALTHPSRAALRVPRPKQLAPTHGRPSPVQSPAIPLNRSVEQVLNKC